MKCIAFIQTKGGQATKASLEAAGLGASMGETVAVVSGDIEGDAGLGAVGVGRILQGAEQPRAVADGAARGAWSGLGLGLGSG